MLHGLPGMFEKILIDISIMDSDFMDNSFNIYVYVCHYLYYQLGILFINLGF